MKLSVYAKTLGLSYTTVYRHWLDGKIKGHQLESGTIIVEEPKITVSSGNRAVLYARVSSAENKDNLESQLNRIKAFAEAKGYIVVSNQ